MGDSLNDTNINNVGACVQAELEKGIKTGRARLTELEQRAAVITAEGGDVEGEDPVSSNKLKPEMP